MLLGCRLQSLQRGSATTEASDSTSVALKGLCDRALRAEVASEQVYVAATTRALINSDVLVALKAASGAETTPVDFETAAQLAERANGSFSATPVNLPHSSQCSFTLAEPKGVLPITLDLSMPFTNPYTDRARNLGYLARLRIGGQAGSWYWVGLQSVGRTWRVTDVVRLPIDD